MLVAVSYDMCYVTIVRGEVCGNVTKNIYLTTFRAMCKAQLYELTFLL